VSERDVMASYLTELRRCLKPGRFAFIEYSNLGAYAHPSYPAMRQTAKSFVLPYERCTGE
jgi:hypothetical protein